MGQCQIQLQSNGNIPPCRFTFVDIHGKMHEIVVRFSEMGYSEIYKHVKCAEDGVIHFGEYALYTDDDLVEIEIDNARITVSRKEFLGAVATRKL